MYEMIYELDGCEIAVKMDILGAKLRIAQRNGQFASLLTVKFQIHNRLRHYKAIAKRNAMQSEWNEWPPKQMRRNTNQTRYV